MPDKKPMKKKKAPYKSRAKVAKVMEEFKEGELRSGGKTPVTNRKQAVAIALSEAGLSKKKTKKK